MSDRDLMADLKASLTDTPAGEAARRGLRVTARRSGDEIVVSMDEQTAETLHRLLMFIGGSPEGPRGRMDAVRGALRGCGLRLHRKMDVDGRIRIRETDG